MADGGGRMNRGGLKLNHNKIELIVCSSKRRIREMNNRSWWIGDKVLIAVPSVRNLGIIMDSGLTMEKEVRKACCWLPD